MGLFFVCKKFAPDGKTHFGDYIPVDDTLHSIGEQERAERLALRKYLESGGKEEYFVIEGKLVYKPTISNGIGGIPVEPETVAAAGARTGAVRNSPDGGVRPK